MIEVCVASGGPVGTTGIDVAGRPIAMQEIIKITSVVLSKRCSFMKVE